MLLSLFTPTKHRVFIRQHSHVQSVSLQVFWQRQKPEFKFLCVSTRSVGLRCSCNRITVASWPLIFYLCIITTAECVWTQVCQGPSLQTPPSWSWKNEQLPFRSVLRSSGINLRDRAQSPFLHLFQWHYKCLILYNKFPFF